MSEDQFCLFWIDHWVTCLTKEQWAAWVQAIGGVLGLAVAIAVPWWMKFHETRQQKESDLARAHIVAASLLMQHNQIIGCLEFAEGAVRYYLNQKAETFIDVNDLRVKLLGLDLPKKKDILAIQSVDQELALILVRAGRLTGQITYSFSMMKPGKLREHLAEIYPYLKANLNAFRESKSRLDAFITQIEGEETESDDIPEQVASTSGQ